MLPASLPKACWGIVTCLILLAGSGLVGGFWWSPEPPEVTDTTDQVDLAVELNDTITVPEAAGDIDDGDAAIESFSNTSIENEVADNGGLPSSSLTQDLDIDRNNNITEIESDGNIDDVADSDSSQGGELFPGDIFSPSLSTKTQLELDADLHNPSIGPESAANIKDSLSTIETQLELDDEVSITTAESELDVNVTDGDEVPLSNTNKELNRFSEQIKSIENQLKSLEGLDLEGFAGKLDAVRKQFANLQSLKPAELSFEEFKDEVNEVEDLVERIEAATFKVNRSFNNSKVLEALSSGILLDQIHRVTASFTNMSALLDNRKMERVLVDLGLLQTYRNDEPKEDFLKRFKSDLIEEMRKNIKDTIRYELSQKDVVLRVQASTTITTATDKTTTTTTTAATTTTTRLTTTTTAATTTATTLFSTTASTTTFVDDFILKGSTAATTATTRMPTTPFPTTTTTHSTPTTTSITTTRIHAEAIDSSKEGSSQDCERKPRPYPDSCHMNYFQVRWYFNTTAGRCEQYWGGCEPDNYFPTRENKFKSLTLCEQSCVNPGFPAVCRLNKSFGLCDGYKKRWHYVVGKGCNEFYYSGCLGNANRFITRMECENSCSAIENFPDFSPNISTAETKKISGNTRWVETSASPSSIPSPTSSPMKSTKNYEATKWDETSKVPVTPAYVKTAPSYAKTTQSFAQTTARSFSSFSPEGSYDPASKNMTQHRASTSKFWTQGPHKVDKHWKPISSGGYEVSVYGPSAVEVNDSFELVCEVKPVGREGWGRRNKYRTKLPAPVIWIQQALVSSHDKYLTSDFNNGNYDQLTRVKVLDYTTEQRFYCLVGCVNENTVQSTAMYGHTSVCLQAYKDVRIVNKCTDELYGKCSAIQNKRECNDKGTYTRCCASCRAPFTYLPRNIFKDLINISTVQPRYGS